MPLADPPRTAAWLHRDARVGFEVVYFKVAGPGWRIDGGTNAIEDGRTWRVDYTIEVDTSWVARRAHVRVHAADGARQTRLEADGRGQWWVDGAEASHLTGCLDVDLESSAMTNALPVRRMRLAVGERAEAPAAYVRALDLDVERLEQTYLRVDDDGGHERYDYRAPVFDFSCRLVYDASGLVLDYPGIAVRAG